MNKPPVRFGRLCCLVVLAALLQACGGENVYRLGPKTWRDVQFVVETRPSPPTAGMVEFLVIATHPNQTQAYDMIISLRINDQGPWKQAIQDGYVGVYRRALAVRNVATDHLSIQIRKKDGSAAGILDFALAPPSAAGT